MASPAGRTPDAEPRSDEAAFNAALRTEMDELRGMVRTLLARSSAVPEGDEPPDLPDELQSYYTRLIQNEVAAELAGEIMAEAEARLAGWKSQRDGECADPADVFGVMHRIANQPAGDRLRQSFSRHLHTLPVRAGPCALLNDRNLTPAACRYLADMTPGARSRTFGETLRPKVPD